MRIVIALGGNALLRRGERHSVAAQGQAIATAARALAPLVRAHQVVITHGNGPQIGLLALQQASSAPALRGPLDLLGAETEGMLGYLIEEELRAHVPGREIAALLTQVVVRPDDPAWSRPAKPIGPVYDQAAAERLVHEWGWTVGRDGAGWRRLVASPEPLQIVELTAIRVLLDAGVTVICAGGGGIPVVRDAAGALRGVEAVIDKDLASGLLATALKAEALLLLTDVDGVYDDWGADSPRLLHRATVAELRARTFAPGSMGPKVEAACRFAAAGGTFAAIGALSAAPTLLEGTGGTRITA